MKKMKKVEKYKGSITPSVKGMKKKKKNNNNSNNNNNNNSDEHKTLLKTKKNENKSRNPKKGLIEITKSGEKIEEKNKKKIKKIKTHNEPVHNKSIKRTQEDISVNQTKNTQENERSLEGKTNLVDDERFRFDDVLWKTCQKENLKKGIIYLPSIPLGMSISKIKEIFAEYGPIENVHLNKFQNTDVEIDIASKEKYSYKIRKYADGFIEYSNKKDAMRVEKLLNNKVVGGKKRKNIARECIWHVKYIKDITWNDITEQIIQRKIARKDKFKFAIKQMYKDYSNYLEARGTKYTTQLKNKQKQSHTGDKQTMQYKKNIPFGKINRNSNNIIKDTAIIDPFEKQKQEIITGTNQKQTYTHTSNQKSAKSKEKNKTISADLVKLFL